MRPFLFSRVLKKDVYSCTLIHLGGEREIGTSFMFACYANKNARFWTPEFSRPTRCQLSQKRRIRVKVVKRSMYLALYCILCPCGLVVSLDKFYGLALVCNLASRAPKLPFCGTSEKTIFEHFRMCQRQM